MKYFAILMLFVSCAGTKEALTCGAPEPVQVTCPRCPEVPVFCEYCLRVCGDGGVRRCERTRMDGEERCECK